MRLPGGRRLTVYLPPNARAKPRNPYSLLVMHDGQNLFEPDRAFVKGEHWRAGETADRLVASRAIPPIVICGIDHGGDERIHEMTPTPGPDNAGGGLSDYGNLVVKEVLPLIRAQFPVRRDRKSTALGGSSLGGLATLGIMIDHPGVFSRAMVMSPSVWWDGRVILDMIAKRPQALADMRMWLDVGLDEGVRAIDDARRLAKLLADIGSKSRGARSSATAGQAAGLETSYIEEPGADHSERSWAQRFGRALVFLFGR